MAPGPEGVKLEGGVNVENRFGRSGALRPPLSGAPVGEDHDVGSASQHELEIAAADGPVGPPGLVDPPFVPDAFDGAARDREGYPGGVAAHRRPPRASD